MHTCSGVSYPFELARRFYGISVCNVSRIISVYELDKPVP